MTQSPAEPVLACRDLVVDRSGTAIVRGISLDVRPGEVTVILGANGAGKTTLLESISGLVPVKSGSVMLRGSDVTRASIERRARQGLVHIEQGRPVFGQMTVEENLLVVAPKNRLEEAYEFFPELKTFSERRAGLLSGGEQQMLVIARALLRDPKVLLLDELSLGLAPRLVTRIIPRIREIADKGIGVLLVEQFARLALQVGDHAYIIARGSVEFDGECSTLLADEGLISAAYFRSGAA